MSGDNKEERAKQSGKEQSDSRHAPRLPGAVGEQILRREGGFQRPFPASHFDACFHLQNCRLRALACILEKNLVCRGCVLIEESQSEAVLIDSLKRLSYHIRDSKNCGDVAFQSVLPLFNCIVGKAVGVDWQVDYEARRCALLLNEFGLFGSAGFSLISCPLERLAPDRIASDIKSERPFIPGQGLDVADDNVFITLARRNQFLLRIALGQLKSSKPIPAGRFQKSSVSSAGRRDNHQSRSGVFG